MRLATVEQLLRVLAAEGTATSPGDHAGGLVLTAYRGAPVQPPARLLVTDADLHALLRALATEDVQVLWPDVDVDTGAFYLLLSLLEEELQRYDLQVDVLRVGPDGVRATPRPGWQREPVLDPDESYTWDAGHPPSAWPR